MVAEKWAYFLFGDLAIKFDWLSRPNVFEFHEAAFVCHGLKIIGTQVQIFITLLGL